MNKIEKNKLKYENKLFNSTSCGEFIVLEYKNTNNVVIKFILTGYITITSSGHIRSGLIKDPFYPFLYGRGFVGEEHRKNTESLVAFKFWRHMMDRCYKEGYCHKSYDNVDVCEDWYNFSNFKKWFDLNYIEGFELDKDYLQIGINNKIYSPDTCVFLPKELNCMWVSRGNNKDNLPTGIRYCGNNFEGRFKHKNKIKSKVFTDLQEAVNFYMNCKREVLRSMADKYELVIDNRVIKILRTF